MIWLRYFHQLVLLSHRALDNSALRVTVCFTASRLPSGVALTGVRPGGFLAALGLPAMMLHIKLPLFVSDLRVRHHVHVLLIRWCDQPVCIVTRAPSRLRCRQYHPVQITDHTQP